MDTHRASTEKYTSAYGATNGLRSEKQQSGLAGRSEIDQELAELTDHGKMPTLHGPLRLVLRGYIPDESAFPDRPARRMLTSVGLGWSAFLKGVGLGVGVLLLGVVCGLCPRLGTRRRGLGVDGHGGWWRSRVKKDRVFILTLCSSSLLGVAICASSKHPQIAHDDHTTPTPGSLRVGPFRPASRRWPGAQPRLGRGRDRVGSEIRDELDLILSRRERDSCLDWADLV